MEFTGTQFGLMTLAGIVVGTGGVLLYQKVKTPAAAGGVLPAGQNGLNPTPGLYLPSIIGRPPGSYAGWLAYNGFPCARWMALTREQQLQFLRAWFLYGDRTTTTRGNDAYNQQFTTYIVSAFPMLQRQSTLNLPICDLPTNPSYGHGGTDPHFSSQAARDSWASSHPTCWAPSYQSQYNSYQYLQIGRPWVLGIQNQIITSNETPETQLARLLQIINDDCLRVSVRAETSPVPSATFRPATPTTPVYGAKTMAATRPAGQYQPVRVNVYGGAFVQPGAYAAWLSHNRVSCDQWASMPRNRKQYYLRDFIFLSSPDAFSSNLYGNIFDPYNAGMRRTMLAALGSPVETVFRFLYGNGQPGGVVPLSSRTEAGIEQIISAIDADCLRAAVNATNAPRPSVPIRPYTPTTPVYGAKTTAAMRPAGQVPYIVCTPNDPNSFLGLCGVPIGTGAAWLSHNGFSCDRWSLMTRTQKLQYVRNFTYGASYGIVVPMDAYNVQFRNHITTLSGYRLGVGTFWPTWPAVASGNVPYLDPVFENVIARVVTAIDADCLRVAVSATNRPVPSVAHAMRPSGQAGPSDTDLFQSGASIDRRFLFPNYTGWLSHNGMSCNQWSAMTRDQKQQYLRNFLFSPTGPSDPYNVQFRQTVSYVAGIQTGVGVREFPPLNPFQRGGTIVSDVAPKDSRTEAGIGHLSSLIDADCLRAAVVATNAPHPSAPFRPYTPTTPVYGAKTTAAMRPAGQIDQLRPLRITPGAYVSWLTHNGWSCARWSALSRAQQLQMLRATFTSGDYSWSPHGADAYNQQFLTVVMNKYPLLGRYPRLYPGGVGGWWAQTQSDTNLFGSSDTQEAELSRLLQEVNNDCLGAAVTAETHPVPSAPFRPYTPTTPVYGAKTMAARPAG